MFYAEDFKKQVLVQFGTNDEEKILSFLCSQAFKTKENVVFINFLNKEILKSSKISEYTKQLVK